MGAGMSKVSVENFLSDSAGTFRRGTIYCVIIFGYRKILCFRGLRHDFSSKVFCPTLPKIFVEEPFCAVFQNFSGNKKFMDKRWEYRDFLPESFCFSAEKRRKHPFSLSLISGIEKVWIRGRGEECQDIPSKIPCLTVPKNAEGEPFSPSLISGIEKVWIRGRGEECQDIPSKIPCLTVPKNAVGEPFSPSLISGIEKVWIRGRGEECQDIPSKIPCLTVPKNAVGEPFSPSLISGIEKV